VNTTILFYGAFIFILGTALGLALYVLMTTAPNSQYAKIYAENGYASAAYRGFFGDSDYNLLGLVTQALDAYRAINEDQEEEHENHL